MPPAHDLSILIELRDAGSFSAAATRLGVAHTTVSRRLRDLEAHFGTPLTQRRGDRIVLTEAGVRAAEVGERIDLEVAALERGISGHNDRASGHPPDTLHGRVIERFDFLAYAARTLPEAELSAYRWLDYRSHECAARAADWIRQHANGAHPRVYLPTPLMMLSALKRAMGAGMLPSAIGDADKSLRRLSDAPAFSIDVWLLAPKELRRTTRVRALFEAFEPRRVASAIAGQQGPAG